MLLPEGIKKRLVAVAIVIICIIIITNMDLSPYSRHLYKHMQAVYCSQPLNLQAEGHGTAKFRVKSCIKIFEF